MNNMSNNQLHKEIIRELVKKHPNPKECFLSLIDKYPEDKDKLERIAVALRIKL